MEAAWVPPSIGSSLTFQGAALRPDQACVGS
jgi:hypothetical protein